MRVFLIMQVWKEGDAECFLRVQKPAEGHNNRTYP